MALIEHLRPMRRRKRLKDMQAVRSSSQRAWLQNNTRTLAPRHILFLHLTTIHYII